MRVFALLFVACACIAQTAPAPPSPPISNELIRLARLRIAATSLFEKLPNITCTLSIERSNRPNASRKFHLVDNLRLEVGLINGQELYAWPGSKNFDDRGIADMVGRDGAIGSGDFAIHAKSIVLSGHTKLWLDGEVEYQGRRADRWRFHHPIATSQYNVRIPPIEGEVGYSGTLLSDSISRDLLRIEMDINEIPPFLPLKSGHKIITYQRVRIGETPVLLPQISEMTLIHGNGVENYNRTTFSNCRQFTGESTLIFEDVDGSAPAAPATIAWSLPDGLSFEIKPVADVDLFNSATGDQVRFLVGRNALSAKQLALPAGASVGGRIAAVTCSETPLQHCFALIRLESFAFDNKEGSIHASLSSPSLEQQMVVVGAHRRGFFAGVPREYIIPPPGSGVIFVRGKIWSKSAPSVWRTVKGPGGNQP
ncbi:MAG: hypothetical protein C0504_19880 [Candidatus Solibacter sp.]|nr:hypothetical protein [Candidatus Solibacter sp.]